MRWLNTTEEGSGVFPCSAQTGSLRIPVTSSAANVVRFRMRIKGCTEIAWPVPEIEGDNKEVLRNVTFVQVYQYDGPRLVRGRYSLGWWLTLRGVADLVALETTNNYFTTPANRRATASYSIQTMARIFQNREQVDASNLMNVDFSQAITAIEANDARRTIYQDPIFPINSFQTGIDFQYDGRSSLLAHIVIVITLRTKGRFSSAEMRGLTRQGSFRITTSFFDDVFTPL